MFTPVVADHCVYVCVAYNSDTEIEIFLFSLRDALRVFVLSELLINFKLKQSGPSWYTDFVNRRKICVFKYDGVINQSW